MECDYTSCVWNDLYKGCIKPKGRTCPRPLLEKMKKQQTNADRIRAMSDEELQKILDVLCICKHIKKSQCGTHKNCDECMLAWLKQPADMRGEEE